MKFNPLDYPICFSKPHRFLDSSAWNEHVPFGMFLIDLLWPKIVVELGTHSGVSYSAFCQAVNQLGLPTQCYAVDLWEGDTHAGYYGENVLMDFRTHHDPLYNEFSKLMQISFDDALKYFSDGSIDLLHIDGLHTYEAVKNDFEKWFPKMSDRGVVLFHDISEKKDDFGVWKLWDELKMRYPSFEFIHGHGLGVLATGKKYPDSLNLLFEPASNANNIRDFFCNLGSILQKDLISETEKEQFKMNLAILENELIEIKCSKGWKILTIYRKFINNFNQKFIKLS